MNTLLKESIRARVLAEIISEQEDKIVSVDYGNLNYEKDDVSIITFEIKPKDCKFTF